MSSLQNPIARALSPGSAPGQNFLRWRLFRPRCPGALRRLGRGDRRRGTGLREITVQFRTILRNTGTFIAKMSAAVHFSRAVGARGCGLPVGNLPHASSSSRRAFSLPGPTQRSARSKLRWPRLFVYRAEANPGAEKNSGPCRRRPHLVPLHARTGTWLTPRRFGRLQV